MKYLILANHYNSLRIFRRELLQALSKKHEVVVSIPPCDDENRKLLESYGTRVIITPMSRRGLNPFVDLKLLWDYIRLLKAERPDRVVCYTVKCNIYGAFACRWCGIPHFANVTGLGTPLEKGGMAGFVVSTLYRLALKRASRVFFENPGDCDRIVSKGILRREQTQVMAGAGVNLEEFAYTPYPKEEGKVSFLFVGRIMQEKGCDELFDAIRNLHDNGIAVQFDFIGWFEEHYEAQVRELERDGLIRFHGFQDDVRPFITQCHCVILPSWHEGMSNTLLEGASMGRPLITTDVHGCREAVEDGKTGFLVPLRNSQALTSVITQFVFLSHEEKERMGIMGRKRMEEFFDKRMVVAKTLEIVEG